MIHTESRRIGHPATEATRAKATSLARKCHDSAVPTVFAPDAKKAVNWNATAKIGLEFVKHEGRQFASPASMSARNVDQCSCIVLKSGVVSGQWRSYGAAPAVA